MYATSNIILVIILILILILIIIIIIIIVVFFIYCICIILVIIIKFIHIHHPRRRHHHHHQQQQQHQQKHEQQSSSNVFIQCATVLCHWRCYLLLYQAAMCHCPKADMAAFRATPSGCKPCDAWVSESNVCHEYNMAIQQLTMPSTTKVLRFTANICWFSTSKSRSSVLLW